MKRYPGLPRVLRRWTCAPRAVLRHGMAARTRIDALGTRARDLALLRWLA